MIINELTLTYSVSERIFVVFLYIRDICIYL